MHGTTQDNLLATSWQRMIADMAIAIRANMPDMRAGSDAIGGPAPFGKTIRSRFPQALNEVMVWLGRGGASVTTVKL